MNAIPDLHFAGNCVEAPQFYRESIGADILAFVRFADIPGATADARDKVMHAELGIGYQFTIPGPTNAAGQRRSC